MRGLRQRGMLIVLGFLAFATAMQSGCASPCRNRQCTGCSPHSSEQGVAPNLVLPSPQLLQLELSSLDDDIEGQPRGNLDPRLDFGQWEFARHDSHLGVGSVAVLAAEQFVEIRHREFLRTVNGRPSEYTTTQTHTIKRDVVRR